MPVMTQHHARNIVKMLNLGVSGVGKTGALASLAKAGYNIRIVDWDNGLDLLSDILADDPQALSRIIYETFTDEFSSMNGNIIMKKAPTAWANAIRLLDEWKVADIVDPVTKEILSPGYNLGKLSTWTPNDVLVLDTMSFGSEAAMRHALAMNGRLNARPQIQDWGAAQDLVEGLLQIVCSKQVPCNVIVNSHVTMYELEEDKDQRRLMPMVPGKKLAPRIGAYFNTVVNTVSTGVGAMVKKKIITRSTQNIDLKTSIPTKIKPEYPIETGLAEIFFAIRGEHPAK